MWTVRRWLPGCLGKAGRSRTHFGCRTEEQFTNEARQTNQMRQFPILRDALYLPGFFIFACMLVAVLSVLSLLLLQTNAYLH